MSIAVVVFVICAAACVIAHSAILASTIGRPARVERPAEVPRPHRLVEFAWALVPILALALVLTATWGRVRDRDAKPVEILKVAR